MSSPAPARISTVKAQDGGLEHEPMSLSQPFSSSTLRIQLLPPRLRLRDSAQDLACAMRRNFERANNALRMLLVKFLVRVGVYGIQCW